MRLEPSDYSVVRDEGEDPRLIHGCSRRGVGRLRQASNRMAIRFEAQSLPSHKVSSVQIQGALTSIGCQLALREPDIFPSAVSSAAQIFQTSALPLIALPGISPRIVTGRKTLSSRLLPVAYESGARAAAAPFSPSLYGEKVPVGG